MSSTGVQKMVLVHARQVVNKYSESEHLWDGHKTSLMLTFDNVLSM